MIYARLNEPLRFFLNSLSKKEHYFIEVLYECNSLNEPLLRRKYVENKNVILGCI